MTVVVHRFTVPASTGNLDITTTKLGGATPKGVLFICGGSDAGDGLPTARARIGVGAATASTERWVVSTGSRHGQASTDTFRQGKIDQCIYCLTAASGSALYLADFVSFITNGVRVNFTTAPGGYTVIAIFFAGDDVEAHADTFNPGTTVNGTVDITDPGFQPDLVFFAAQLQQMNDVEGSNHILSFGVAIDDGSDTQMASFSAETDGQAAGDPFARVQNNRAVWTWVYECEIGTFDASGFSSTLRIASAGTDDVGYLAIKTGANLSLEVFDSPTSTGNASSTAPGYTPDVLISMLTYLESVNASSNDDTAGSYGISAIDAIAENIEAFAIEDAADPTDTESQADNKAINLPSDDSSSSIEADFVSFDSSGWTLNFTQVEANAKKFLVLAIGEPPAPSEGLPERKYPRGVNRGVMRGVV